MEPKQNPTDPTPQGPAAGSKPKAPETPAQPTPPAKPDFLLDKYQTVEDQAKAVAGAVREMKIKEQEAALLRKELELERQSKSTPKQQQPSEMTPEIIKQLEEKYRMPIGEIQLRHDLARINNEEIEQRIERSIKPLKETILSDKVETLKSALKDDPVYQEYGYEFEAKLNSLPIEERANPRKINEIRNAIAVDHFQELLDKARNEGARSVKGQPATPPAAVGGHTAPPIDAPKPVLTEAQRKAIQDQGDDPLEVEKYLKGELPSQKQSGWAKYVNK